MSANRFGAKGSNLTKLVNVTWREAGIRIRVQVFRACTLIKNKRRQTGTTVPGGLIKQDTPVVARDTIGSTRRTGGHLS